MSSASVFDQPTWASAASYTYDQAKLPAVMFMSLNEDGSLLLVGTLDGFLLYSMENANPFTEQEARAFAGINSAASARSAYDSNRSDTFSESSWGAQSTDVSGIFAARQEATSRVSNAMRELCRRSVFGGVGRAAFSAKRNMLLLAGATPSMSLTVTLWDDFLYDKKAAEQHKAKSEAYAAELLKREKEEEIRKKRREQNKKSGNNREGVEGEEDDLPPLRPLPAEPALPPHILAQVVYDLPIRAMKINPYCIIIADTNTVTVYNNQLQTNPSLTFPTYVEGLTLNNSNTIGCNLETFTTTSALAKTSSIDIVTLGLRKGEIRTIEFVTAVEGKSVNVNPATLLHKATERFLQPHRGNIKTIAVAASSRVAATVAEGGTAIKIIYLDEEHYKMGTSIVRQFSRGTTVNMVPALALSARGDLCVCVSESGTLHCFAISDNLKLAAPAAVNNATTASQWSALGSSASAAGGKSVAGSSARGGPASSSAGGRSRYSASSGGGADMDGWDDAFSHMNNNAGFAPLNSRGGGGGPQALSVRQTSPPPHADPLAALPQSSSSSSFFGGIYSTVTTNFLPQQYQNTVNYLKSSSAFATAALFDEGVDVESYSHHFSSYGGDGANIPLTAAYCCCAIRPEVCGRFRIIVAIGGLSCQSKGRCLHVDLDAKGAERVATFVFPRDPL